mmetsp:Transcript_119934/g.344669  ORF Transcript_119934/g.344669 Transcript_119934/m.344669 type:complete len:249 (+) Transcript_119934:194-940(+)
MSGWSERCAGAPGKQDAPRRFRRCQDSETATNPVVAMMAETISAAAVAAAAAVLEAFRTAEAELAIAGGQFPVAAPRPAHGRWELPLTQDLSGIIWRHHLGYPQTAAQGVRPTTASEFGPLPQCPRAHPAQGSLRWAEPVAARPGTRLLASAAVPWNRRGSPPEASTPRRPTTAPWLATCVSWRWRPRTACSREFASFDKQRLACTTLSRSRTLTACRWNPAPANLECKRTAAKAQQRTLEHLLRWGI